ncbi:hypothetical protein H5410_056211 [Solanum commersonii]|uniref:Uncharacterized protein n=1 Tax=Solanum commersonii TaxID=4109 RepID=A0A9J5WL16_SOLCO|nr:hypothetical protein H5410_056211 [Solanum commersonii]
MPSLLGESPKGKDQVGGKKEQSAHHREILRSSTMSPNDPKHDDAERWCKMAMNYTESYASIKRIDSCKYKFIYVFSACSRERSRHEVQLERVNPSPMSTHSTRKSEWVKVYAGLHAANGCPRGTHLKRAKLLKKELILLKV